MAAKLQTMRSGGTQHPEEIMNFLMSQYIKTPGVIGVISGDLLVTQETVPAMSVKVAQGHAALKASGANIVYPGWLTDADASVSISSNASGNPRKDAIVLYVDKGATPNPDITNVLKLVAIAGTPAGSPTSPSDATIQAAIGSANPFLRLADVTVASGAVSILDASILDTRAEAMLDIEKTINNATAKTTPVDADVFPLVDSAASYVLKKLSFLNLKNAITSWNNPIGTIREFDVSTNPATLLGIGTWAAKGTGRVTVAIDAGQTEFDVLGETGGEKTHVLTTSEMAAHTHTFTTGTESANHTHVMPTMYNPTGSHGHSGNDNSVATAPNNPSGSAGTPGLGTQSANHTHSGTTGNGSGSGTAHNNLQPYIVVYRWVRTA